MTPFQIAIDGPVAAGKGTVARLVAERLGFLYVDTGAMYRMTAYLAQQEGASMADEVALADLVEEAQMDMRNPNDEEKDGRLTTVLLNGEDVSWKIRTEEMSRGSSQVAQYPLVRQVLVSKQQRIAAQQDVVMEGRDITYRVLPTAQLKIYLTASDIVRAKRRHLQLQAKGQDIGFEEVYRDLLQRDHQDMTRPADPLKQVPEAWVVDTSDLSIEQAVEMIVAKAKILMDYAQTQQS